MRIKDNTCHLPDAHTVGTPITLSHNVRVSEPWRPSRKSGSSECISRMPDGTARVFRPAKATTTASTASTASTRTRTPAMNDIDVQNLRDARHTVTCADLPALGNIE